jgi:hypothetical protein
VTQIPQLIWPDHLLAAGADEELPPLEAAGKLTATADVLRPVQLALAAVVDQPTASSPIGLDRARFRALSTIGVDRSQSSNRGGNGSVWVVAAFETRKTHLVNPLRRNGRTLNQALSRLSSHLRCFPFA